MFTNRFEKGVSKMRPLPGSFPSGLKAQLRIELLPSIVFSVLALSVVFFWDNQVHEVAYI
jgi:hypothetical protein